MTLEFFFINIAMGVLLSTAILAIVAVLLVTVTKMKKRTALALWFIGTVLITVSQVLSTSNQPKVRLTDQILPRDQSTNESIVDLSPKQLSDQERFEQNKKLLESNKQ